MSLESTARIRDHRNFRPGAADLVPQLFDSGGWTAVHSAGSKKDPRRGGGRNVPRGLDGTLKATAGQGRAISPGDQHASMRASRPYAFHGG